MAKLPFKCPHCGGQNYHYSVCRCPLAQLDGIEQERRAIALRLARLDEREAEERVRYSSLSVEKKP